MTSQDLWPRIEQLYHAALTRAEGERTAFLREACGGDEALQREVESLLLYAMDAQGFMATPAMEVMAASELEGGAAIGQRLGPYEIESRLGAGGMGEVYCARDTNLGRRVAVKILPKAFSADAERRARFEREARLLAALNHPHIGAIYGVEQGEGIHGLILELVEGQTLAELLRNGGLPVANAVAIACQIAEALEAAHDKGIVHRDLKPANIAITPDGGVKVFDFGLAKATVEDSGSGLTHSPTLTIGFTSAGVILGTAAYMSPEQARGKAVDRRTDIWAFGCVLFEMLTGRKAFVGETVSDTIVGVLDREPDWAALPETTPPAVRRLLQRCLDKDAKRRLHHVADARIELEDLAGEPVASAVAPHPSDSRPRARANTVRTWVVTIAAAVALVAIGAVVRVAWRPARPIVRNALARVMIALPAAQALEKGRFPPMALSRDGRLLAYAATVRGGRTTLFLRPLDDLTVRAIEATEGASAPFFSPDGRWLAFYADGFLKKVPVAGGVPLTICEAPPIWSASWGENDTIVFSSTLPKSGLWVVSANGGEPVQITTPEPDQAQHAYPQILPAGREVLFSVRRGEAWYLASLTLETRTWRLLGNGRSIGEAAQYVPTGHLVYSQGGGLVATPFDPRVGQLNQPPVPLLERVDTSHFGGAYFAFSADSGTLVYAPAGTAVTERALLRVDREGRAAPLLETRAAYETPSFSPDGRQVAVTIASEPGTDIWLVDLQRAARVRFTTGGTSAFPVWDPDGSRLAFQATVLGPWNLFWRGVNEGTAPQPFLSGASDDIVATSWRGTGATVLPGTLPTLSGTGPQFPVSWAPDGMTLAFHERKPSGERDIWTVSAGNEPMPFLLTAFDEHSPRFSPDNRWLAYVSDESGRSDVYVQPFPGPGPKWLLSTDGGSDPVWSKDGRELFYRNGDQLMAVAVATRGEFSAARPRRLFEFRFDASDNGSNYDVSPDGSWFVMPRSDDAPAPSQLHLVLGWFGEVTARAGSGSAHQSLNRSPRLAFEDRRPGLAFQDPALHIENILAVLWKHE